MQIYIQLDDLGGPFLHGPLSRNHLRGMPWILSWSFDRHSTFRCYDEYAGGSKHKVN